MRHQRGPEFDAGVWGAAYDRFVASTPRWRRVVDWVSTLVLGRPSFDSVLSKHPWHEEVEPVPFVWILEMVAKPDPVEWTPDGLRCESCGKTWPPRKTEALVYRKHHPNCAWIKDRLWILDTLNGRQK